jgi:hypothetical protein
MLLQTAVPAAVLAQGFDEKSIQEPTQFSVVVSDATAHATVVGSPTLVKSDESIAEIALIEITTSADTRRLGVRASLRGAGQVDTLYLDPSEASQLREELVGFDTWYEPGQPCEAIRQCVRGVARCRPSQSVRQAFCPSLYSTAEGEQGILISTPRSSFRFPAIKPSIFISAIDMVVGELNERTAREQSDDEP